MKKLLFILLIAASLPSFGQSWAAPGATWYYDFVYFSMTGYERIQNIGDTVIGAHQYNILQTYRSWYDYSTQTPGNYMLPQLEFTRSDSGVVYYYRDSAEYVLYDFNAQPGDTWLLRADVSLSGSPCDTGSVVVDSVTTVIINGDTLRKLYTTGMNANGLTFILPVVEKIGGLANLFPYAYCFTDFPQGYNLRCYSDSSGWIYHNPNWAYACDDIAGMNDLSKQELFKIATDQQTQTITLSGAQIIEGALIEVYDSKGQLLQEETAATNGKTELQFNGLAGGIYFVSVTTSNGRASRSFCFTGQ